MLPTVQDEHLECQGIVVRSDDVEVEIVNIYIPPVSACTPGYRPNIEHILSGDLRIVVGDLYAHHESWFSALGNDARGSQIAEQIDDSDFCAINEDHPTRVVANRNSSPDITIVSPSLLTCASWHAD